MRGGHPRTNLANARTGRGRQRSQILRVWLLEVFVLALILSTVTGLSLWHARLGGFDSPQGFLVGGLVLVLLFSPVIDWLLDKGYGVVETSLFRRVKDWVGVGALLFAVMSATGIVLAFALNPSGEGLIGVIRALLNVFL